MTKTDLIRILIKLGGILILFDSLPGNISQLVGFWNNEVLIMSLISFMLILTISFSFWLIFGTDSVIALFKLDKGFDDDKVNIDQLNAEKLVSFAVLIIGGLFILHSFAPLLVELIQKAKIAVGRNPFLPSLEQADNTKLIVEIAEFCAGYLLISNYNRVARFLASKNKDNNQPE